MPRWHHSDSSSEKYQEVKFIKTFYAAHISRSQVKSMFGNWTIVKNKFALIMNRWVLSRGSGLGNNFLLNAFSTACRGCWLQVLGNS